MSFSCLWKAPQVNPKNLKATSIPVLNPFNLYGRNFHLAWLGFFVCFLAWFAFPPLLHGKISKDLNLTAVDIANNNIAGLCATLLGRFLLGPICDKFGPRISMASVLLIGAIPTAFVPLVKNVSGLHAIRFFISTLGSSFVTCTQMTNVFFDNNIIGTANALAAGWGNAGGGVAFFVMPAISQHLASDGFNLHKSWSIAFLIGPFLILVFVAALTLVFGRDCPNGNWASRKDILGLNVDNSLVHTVSVTKHLSHNGVVRSVEFEAVTDNKQLDQVVVNSAGESTSGTEEHQVINIDELVNTDEIIEDPTFLHVLKITISPRTMLVALCYITTFGGELAIESILSGLYKQRQPHWSTSQAGAWGSMLGLLNVVTRPLGGIISDLLYHYFKTTKAKKFWMLFCGLMQGIFLVWIGFVPSMDVHSLIGSLAIMSIFMEMGNGANYACVPFINKRHSGIVNGITGAFGNLGGILFSLVFRFTIDNGKSNYFKAFWIIGIVCIAINLLCALIPIREERPQHVTTTNHPEAISEKA